MRSESPIFLDMQSTTPVDRRVLDAMLPYFMEEFGNPHSAEHDFGHRAAAAIEEAADRLARVIGARASDVIFTSGATESNNLAIRGLLKAGKQAHIITTAIEHRSVLGTLEALKRDGHAVTVLPVDKEGFVSVDAIDLAIRAETVLISVMTANSEVGTIQPHAAIAALCRSRGVLFHTDASQAYGKVDIDVERDGIDLMSFSAHKIYGPKGIGALYVRDTVRKRLRPEITGGSQQQGLRAGTVPTPLAVGFGHAAMLAVQERETGAAHVSALRNLFLETLEAAIGPVTINGSIAHRLPGNLNICIDGVDAESLLYMARQVALSTGSACSSGALEPSSVLLALGLSREQAASSLRVGFGRSNTADEVAIAATLLGQAVLRLRA